MGRQFIKNIVGWLQVLDKPPVIEKLSNVGTAIAGFLKINMTGDVVVASSLSTDDLPEIQITDIVNLQESLQNRLTESQSDSKYQVQGDYEPANENIQAHINSYHIGEEKGNDIDNSISRSSPPEINLIPLADGERVFAPETLVSNIYVGCSILSLEQPPEQESVLPNFPVTMEGSIHYIKEIWL